MYELEDFGRIFEQALKVLCTTNVISRHVEDIVKQTIHSIKWKREDGLMIPWTYLHDIYQ